MDAFLILLNNDNKQGMQINFRCTFYSDVWTWQWSLSLLKYRELCIYKVLYYQANAPGWCLI